MNLQSFEIIVLPRSYPDLDGVACAVAYAELLKLEGKNSIYWFTGVPDGEALYVLGRCNSVKFPNNDEVKLAGAYVLVDASDTEGLPEEVDPLKVIEVIDHRLYHKAETVFRNAKLQIEPVGAAATLITEKFHKKEIIPSLTSGMMLYGAIHSNTQCLKGSVTTKRDELAIEWIESVVEIPKDLLDGQFNARKTEILDDLEQAIRREQKSYNHSTGKYIIVQLEFMGAGQLIQTDLDKLVSYLLKEPLRTMLNLVDIATGKSFLIVLDSNLRVIVADALNMKFEESIAESKSVILRKQIVAAMEGIQ